MSISKMSLSNLLSTKIVLASKSPRRKQLLEQMGFEVLVDYDNMVFKPSNLEKNMNEFTVESELEMDEIHANLQKGGNKICPCAIVYEGYEEDFVKRKN